MEEALALKHRPLVYLHPDEKYMPIEFNRYINEAALKHSGSNTMFRPDVPMDDVIFGQWLLDYPQVNTQEYTLVLPRGMASPCIAEYTPTPRDLESVPLYVNCRSVPASNGLQLYVSYTFMYAYNGPESVCGIPFGAHYADSEHVTAQIHVSRHGDVTFAELYNSRHNGGLWIAKQDLTWRQDRPVVFSSLNGHASYHVPGNHCRYWGVAVDRCAYGDLWDSQVLTMLPASWEAAEPRMKWTLFRGNLGDGRVDGFGNKAYLTEADADGEYGASLVPCVWKF